MELQKIVKATHRKIRKEKQKYDNQRNKKKAINKW